MTKWLTFHDPKWLNLKRPLTAVRELGVSMAAMARRLNISIVAVSKSGTRGTKIARNDGMNLV